ncbi:hypothetical protein [Sorangium sp. So ce385]|uniref:hypothetical protein n=1 Tax=Sorangium sp. So ce385 TaxID=3133308 RepID=UPI003F5BDAC2
MSVALLASSAGCKITVGGEGTGGSAGAGGEGGATGSGGAGGAGGATGSGGAGGEGGATGSGGAGGEDGATGSGGAGGAESALSLAWVHGYGGHGEDQAHDIASDPLGNFYVTGTFQGTVDFGAGPLTSAGRADIFLLKLDPSGTLLWSKRFGSTFDETAYTLAVDTLGDIFLAGTYDGDDYGFNLSVDFGGGPLPFEGSTHLKGFAVELDPDGGHLWSRGFLAAPWIYGNNVVQDIAADALGNAYVTIRGGSDQSSVSVAKLDVEGNVVWNHTMPAGGDLNFHGELALDSAGNVLAVSESKAGAPGICPCTRHFAVAKFAPTGDVLWHRAFGPGSTGGSSSDVGAEAFAVAVNAADEVFVLGQTDGSVDFGGGVLPAGTVLVKLDADGEHVFSRSIPFGREIAVDNDDGILINGYNNLTLSSSLSRLDASGAELWTVPFWGGADFCVSPLGMVASAGTFTGPFDFGTGPISVSGPSDAFVLAFSP